MTSGRMPAWIAHSAFSVPDAVQNETCGRCAARRTLLMMSREGSLYRFFCFRCSPAPYNAGRGTLAKYIRLVQSASHGCVTDE
jgi:hypothetical protein